MKIKVDAEKLIAKYLLGDLTDPEKEQLDNWIKSSPQHEEFFNRLCTNMSFRKRYEAYTQRSILMNILRYADVSGSHW